MAASFLWFEFRRKAQFLTVIRRASSMSLQLKDLKLGLDEDYVPSYLCLQPIDRSLCQISTKVSYCACFSSLKVVFFVRRLLWIPSADSADISFVYSVPYGRQTPQITARYLSSSTKNSVLSPCQITEHFRNFQPLLGELAHRVFTLRL